MSVNKDRPHILVIPEDDANNDLLNGFLLECPTRQIRAPEVAGGWRKVLENFQTTHLGEMERNQFRLIVLLIDFDGRPDRLERAKEVIPDNLNDRVFVLGVWTEPEKLKSALSGYSLEDIGGALAKDCRDQSDKTWSHELLRHNAPELERLRERARPILFN